MDTISSAGVLTVDPAPTTAVAAAAYDRGRSVIAAWPIAGPSRWPRGILDASRGSAEQDQSPFSRFSQLPDWTVSGLSEEPWQEIQTQLELINSIINDGVAISVCDHDIRLIPPPRAKVAHLHQPPPPEEEMTDEVRNKFSLYNVAIEAISACIPGLSTDQSAQLMALSGGEDSQLTMKAVELCGLKVIFDFAQSKMAEAIDKASGEPVKTNSHDAGGDLDPTTASSPA